jgi:hypothetical protein
MTDGRNVLAAARISADDKEPDLPSQKVNMMKQ